MQKFIGQITNQKKFVVRSYGPSMFPLIQSYDLVFLEKIFFKQGDINDLILVGKKGNFFIHRIIYKTSSYLITKGDNSLVSDGRVFPKQIVGKVFQIKRNNKLFNPESIYLVQSTLYFQEVIKIGQFFKKKGLDFVFLKGLPLHLCYEKIHPRRLYLDCDVLIDKKNFLRAEKILIKNGYKKAKTELSKTHKKIKNKEVENAYVKIVNNFQVVFDLHLEPAFMMTQLGHLEALYPQKLLDQLTKELLKTKRKVKINNEEFLILNAYYLILYLALHLFHHNFRGAFRYQFLDRVIRKEKLSPSTFQKLIKITKNYQLENFVYPVFILLKKYYKTPIPYSFFKSIKPTNTYALSLGSKIYHLESIFDDEPRIKAGITRFKILFYLSPNPLWKKSLVFLNSQVFYSIFWLFRARLRGFFSFSNRKSNH